MARIFAVTAVSPLELIRTKVQSEKIDYKQIRLAVSDAIRNNGILTLYRGWVSTVWRDVPFTMIYWFNYERFKALLIKRKVGASHLDNVDTFLCGACAGSLSAFITCPLDVVKTLRQVQLGEKDMANKESTKTIYIIKEIFRAKGVSGLFAGTQLTFKQELCLAY